MTHTDRGVLHALRIAGVRHVERRLGTPRDAKCRGRTHVGELRLEDAVAVEDLNALVSFIAHIDVILRVDGDAMDDVELSRAGST